MAAAWARGRAMPFLFMPYFGRGILGMKGSGLLQPIFVDDVASAFAKAALDAATLENVSVDLGGPDRMDWPAMHRIIARHVVGRRRLTVPMPAWWGKTITAVVPEQWTGVNRSQVQMSQEDNICDIAAMRTTLGIEPVGFEQAVAQYASRL
jgi:uncharacterized protein YbjT (DUF2867 family)